MHLKSILIAFGLLMANGCIHASSPDDNVRAEVIKIQIDNSDIKPWVHYGYAIPRATFDAAVSGSPLNFTPDFHINPGYIRSWEWDNKIKAYTFKLDRSLKYHDGRTISAYDFEFALLKGFLTTEPNAKPFGEFKNIPGTEDLKPGMPFRSGMVKGIKVIDDETILVSLKMAPHRFLYALSSVFPALAPIDAFGPDLYTFKGLPIGSGPYKVASLDEKSGMVKLVRVRGEKGPKEVELFYKNLGWQNQVDIAYGAGMSKMKAYLETHPGEYLESQGKVSDSIEVLEFNFSTKAGQNLNFRKAVSMAINKNASIPHNDGLTGTDQIIPSQSYGHREPKTYYDLERAKALFSSLPADIRNATHTIMFHGNPNRKELGPYYGFVFESLKAIGMKIKPSIADFVAFQGKNREITMGVYGTTVDADPVNTFAFYIPDGKKTHTLKNDSELSQAFANLNAAEALEDKVKYVRTLSDLFIDKMVVLPIHESYPIVLHKRKIKNIDFIDINGIIDVKSIEVEYDSLNK